MSLSMSNNDYLFALDRFDELWSLPNPEPKLIEELEILADLISAYEEQRYPLMNNPTYRDLLNERIKRTALKV